MLFFRSLISLSLFTVASFASLQDYLKQAEGKSDVSKMRNIDFIYMINLDERPLKFQSCINQLHPYGIYPYRFSAVNGWNLSFDALREIGLTFQQGMAEGIWGTLYKEEDKGAPHHELIEQYGRSYFCHCMSRGAVGISMSHLSVLQDAYDSGYETIWVMEDDIELIQDPRMLSDLIGDLDSQVGRDGWDFLFTDQDTKDSNGNYVPCAGMVKRPNFYPSSLDQYYQNKREGKFIRKGARFGTYSMIVRRSGIEKVLNFIKEHKVFLPYDMDFYLPPGIRIYALQDDVVSTQPRALSDNGSPGYLTP